MCKQSVAGFLFNGRPVKEANSTHEVATSAQTQLITNVTHISLYVDVSFGLQQHSNNFTVAILSSYYQRSKSILYRVK